MVSLKLAENANLPRSAYIPHKRVTFRTTGESQVQQNAKDECDINNIVKKRETTGLITHISSRPARYGNFITAHDFKSAMDQIIEAQDTFDMLPSEVRKRFANDPAQFLEFAQDPANEAELQKMGLLPPAEEVPAPPVGKGTEPQSTPPEEAPQAE